MKNETKSQKFTCHYSEVLRTAIPAPSLGLLIDSYVDDHCLTFPSARTCFRQYLWTLGPKLLASYATKLDTFVRTAEEIGAELPGLLAMQVLRDDMWEEYKQAHHAANLNEFEPGETIWTDDKTEILYSVWCRDVYLTHVPSLIQALLAEESAAY
jgi:hypothetical protein